jgi:hypothetical protein
MRVAAAGEQELLAELERSSSSSNSSEPGDDAGHQALLRPGKRRHTSDSSVDGAKDRVSGDSTLHESLLAAALGAQADD